MGIVIDPKQRRKGVVFLDPSATKGAATHVMIIGVGSFQSPHVASVTSPIKSALAMADWFLGRDGSPGFQNSERPLGSLAMAISEGDAPASYAGASVPRAKFKSVESAVSAWVDRIDTSKDNFAILYVCSHGESLGAKTAFLLEDYGTKRRNATAGMSEVEQFSKALKNAAPIRQLLIFDCCREKTSMRLPLDGDFGTKLINLAEPSMKDQESDEGRQQWIFSSTALGEASTGRKNMTTVFTDSLLRSLKGAAADPSIGDWRITPADLVRTVPKFLSLHRREHEPLQTPSGTFANPFPICFCAEPKAVQTYLALKDHTQWAGCRLTITGEKEITFEAEDPAGPERFAVAEVKELQAINISAKSKDGSPLGQETRRPRAPAEYVIIGEGKPVRIETIFRCGNCGSSNEPGASICVNCGAALAPARQPSGIVVRAPGPMWLNKAGVIRLTRTDEGRAVELSPELFNMDWPDGQEEEVIPVAAGTYRVTLDTPDGRTANTHLEVQPGSTTEIALPVVRSPQEWLRGAWAAGLVGPPSEDILLDTSPHQPQIRPVSTAEVARKLGWGLAFGMFARIGSQATPNLEISTEPYRQDRFRGFRLSWKKSPDTSKPEAPGWIELTQGPIRELCAIPAIRDEPVSLIVDQRASHNSSVATVAAASGRLTSLLGYLARRDFAAAEIVLKYISDQVSVELATQEEPYAALAAALIAVGSGRHFESNEGWLHYLATFFPTIPDGPIILAHYLARRRRAITFSERNKVQKLLLAGIERGVPVFSLSLEWLESDFAEFSNPSWEMRRASLRRTVVRLDPSKPFTTIRLVNGSGRG